MDELLKLFDAYNLQARLQPALLSLLPAIVLGVVWLPQSSLSAGHTIIGLLMFCGVTLLMSHFARYLGRRLEPKLFDRWGGKPTTSLLRHRDASIDAHTKDRYCETLTRLVKGWTRPTANEEKADPEASDRRYDSAVRWVLEQTRDTRKFGLLFRENVSFGFRRNLLGLKPFAIVLTVGCIAFASLLIFFYYQATGRLHLPWVLYEVAMILVLAIWAFVVTPNWVLDAGMAYGRTALASCDNLGRRIPE